MKNFKNIFYIIILSLIYYVCSYLFFSFAGKEDSFGWEKGKIWSFNGTTQSAHLYHENSKYFDKELAAREKFLISFYQPLIFIDKSFFDNYHILDDECPDYGG